MIQYPISFFTTAEADSGIQSNWKSESQSIRNICAIPTEFDGPGGGLSPEDLFAQSLTNCFVATFKVYAEKSKLNFVKLTVRSELIVDYDELKKPVMKSCILRVVVSGSETPERVQTIAEKAFRSGFIINSVKSEMHMELVVD